MISLLTLICCLHIVIHCIFCINKMARCTDNTIWAYHAVIAIGALFMALNILINEHSPSLGAATIILGVSLKYIFDRRDCQKSVTT